MSTIDRQSRQYNKRNKRITCYRNVCQSVNLDEEATATSNGAVVEIGHFKTLILEIKGTATSYTLFFEASSVSRTYYPIKATKISDFSIAPQTIGKAEVWSFDVTRFKIFRAKLSAIAGRNLTIKARWQDNE